VDHQAQYDLFGVHLDLSTDSDRLADEARFFLGDHQREPEGVPDYRLMFRESDPLPDFGLPDWGTGSRLPCRIVERDPCVFIAVAEGVACLDHGSRSCRGHVRPRRHGRWHPRRSVPLLHPIVLRIMFAQGYLPVHAGAVVCQDRLIVLAGSKGAGKSTLAVALHRQGFPLVCDDLLYLKQTADGLAGGGHSQPLKLTATEADRLPSACRVDAHPTRVTGKHLFSLRKLAPATANRSYPVAAILLLQPRQAGATAEVWPDRPTEVLFHILGDSPLGDLPAYRARALDWLCAIPPGLFHVVQTDSDVDATCRAIRRACA
jgi:hypothetical protein